MKTSPNNIVILPFDFMDELIKSTLDLLNEGTIKSKHTREFWNWRFNQNPFGSCLVWCAKDLKNNKIAGVLLWWPWKY